MESKPKTDSKTTKCEEVKTRHPVDIKKIRTYPNQKKVFVRKDERHDLRDEEHPYGIITRRENAIAGLLLRGNTVAHIIYTDMALNQPEHSFALSPKVYEFLYGITDKQYRTAIKVLKKYGYLVPRPCSPDILDFYRVPDWCKDLQVPDVGNATKEYAEIFWPIFLRLKNSFLEKSSTSKTVASSHTPHKDIFDMSGGAVNFMEVTPTYTPPSPKRRPKGHLSNEEKDELGIDDDDIYRI